MAAEHIAENDAPAADCRKCRYLSEGKWDGAASVSHAPDCPERTSVISPRASDG